MIKNVNALAIMLIMMAFVPTNSIAQGDRPLKSHEKDEVALRVKTEAIPNYKAEILNRRSLKECQQEQQEAVKQQNRDNEIEKARRARIKVARTAHDQQQQAALAQSQQRTRDRDARQAAYEKMNEDAVAATQNEHLMDRLHGRFEQERVATTESLPSVQEVAQAAVQEVPAAEPHEMAQVFSRVAVQAEAQANDYEQAREVAVHNARADVAQAHHERVLDNGHHVRVQILQEQAMNVPPRVPGVKPPQDTQMPSKVDQSQPSDSVQEHNSEALDVRSGVRSSLATAGMVGLGALAVYVLYKGAQWLYQRFFAHADAPVGQWNVPSILHVSPNTAIRFKDCRESILATVCVTGNTEDEVQQELLKWWALEKNLMQYLERKSGKKVETRYIQGLPHLGHPRVFPINERMYREPQNSSAQYWGYIEWYFAEKPVKDGTQSK
jgi:hypothetical protein